MNSIRIPKSGSYADFHAKWIASQEQQLEELRAALGSNATEQELQQRVASVEARYREYYEAKAKAAQQDVLQVASPSWKTPLEKAFQWIGGWRPTMVFQLAYAEAGQMLEAELAELLEGIDTPSMASLTARQLSQINVKQTRTQELEEDLSHRMAVLQQAMADEPLVTLAQLDLAAERSSEDAGLQTAVDEKLKELEDLLREADSLRLETLTEMLKILTPFQGAEYLVAAAQLQKALRRIGQKEVMSG